MSVSKPRGIDLINSIRKRLSEKIASDVTNITDIDDTFNVLTGYMAVANALDIITDKEYNDATADLYHYLTGLKDDIVAFDDIIKHYTAESTIQETMLVFKINLQEHLNENFAKYRQHTVMNEYSKNDLLSANDLFLTFGLMFNIISNKEFDQAKKVMAEYIKDKPKTEKIIWVPEALYTKC